MAWEDCQNLPDLNSCVSSIDLYAQRVSAEGQLLWWSNGAPVSTAPGNQGIGPGIPFFSSLVMVTDGDSGAMVAWPDGRNDLCQELTPGCDVFAQRVSDRFSPSEPVISVSPISQDFGDVNEGSSSDKTFTVQNTGVGTLSGSASASGVFSIVSGSPYNLEGGASQIVMVRFSPTSTGSFMGNVIFTGGGGATTTVTGTGVSSEPVVIGMSSLSEGEVNVAYDADLQVSGGLPPYQVNVMKGSLPEGLGFASPEIKEVTDQAGASVSKKFKIKVFEPLSVTTKSLKNGSAGKKYSAIVKAKHGKKPYTWAMTGELPAGLEFDQATGKMTGTPTEAGTFEVTFQVTDPLGGTDEEGFTLIVSE